MGPQLFFKLTILDYSIIVLSLAFMSYLYTLSFSLLCCYLFLPGCLDGTAWSPRTCEDLGNRRRRKKTSKKLNTLQS